MFPVKSFYTLLSASHGSTETCSQSCMNVTSPTLADTFKIISRLALRHIERNFVRVLRMKGLALEVKPFCRSL